ncbi:MAG TPA: hypothetical protein VF104_00185 [Burkholderiales bacterium]
MTVRKSDRVASDRAKTRNPKSEIRDPKTLLHRAARVIAGVAEDLRRSETVGGKWLVDGPAGWSLQAADAKREHDELRALATELRRYARTLPTRSAIRTTRQR